MEMIGLEDNFKISFNFRHYILYNGSNCYVVAVAYLACEGVVLGQGWVRMFILVSVVLRLFRVC